MTDLADRPAARTTTERPSDAPRRAALGAGLLAMLASSPASASSSATLAAPSSHGLTEALLGMTAIGSTWVLWLLLALSVLSVVVIAERATFFLRQRADLLAFTAKLDALLAVDAWDEAADLCRRSGGFEARVAALALEYREHTAEAAAQTLSGFVAAHKRRLDQGLTFLGTLGNNAPFIGLFGTVLGIIDAFHALAANPAGGAGVVMSGISEALVTTAVGLAVAIPAVIAFNAFQRMVRNKLEGAAAVQGVVLGHAAQRHHRLARGA
jgi:biopolymer transport protein ExbB/TolQ